MKRFQRRVLVIFFLFVLFHQMDRLLIGPLKGPISETFGMNNFQFGLVVTSALLVSTVLYPIWGYLYDRYTRPKLVALAAFLWGSTTWLSALAPTYVWFAASRAATGIDDSAYPGLYSLLSDYFGPTRRGRAYGILQLAAPMGYLIGMVLALLFAPAWGWRRVFLLTGGLGLLLSAAIYLGVPEAPRGQSEPELQGLEVPTTFRFSRAALAQALKRPTMVFIMLQGFAGVFPWNVVTYFIFDYLQKERGYTGTQTLGLMGPVVVILATGYVLGGWLGDQAVKRTPRGRVWVAITGVLGGLIFAAWAFTAPVGAEIRFVVGLLCAALMMPFSSPNVVAIMHDITLPEARSTAQALEYFVENLGAATAPALAGWIADRTSMGAAILGVAVVAWTVTVLIYTGALFTIPRDMQYLRAAMAQRAQALRGPAKKA